MTWIRNCDHSTDTHPRLSRKIKAISFGNSIPIVNEKFHSPTTIHDSPKRMINSAPFRLHPSRKRYIARSRHWECTSRDAPLKNVCFSPTSRLLVRSTQEKHCKFFGFTRLFDLNTKKHFKTTRRKRLRISFRTNLRRYQHIRNAPLKAHLRTLIPPNR